MGYNSQSSQRVFPVTQTGQWDLEDMLRKKNNLIHHIPLFNSTHSETGADCFPTVKPD